MQDHRISSFQRDVIERMRAPGINGGARQSFFPFTVTGSGACLIRSIDVARISAVTDLVKAPGVSASTAGLLNVDGDLYSVLDSGVLLGGRPTPLSMKARMLCLTQDHAEAGALVGLLVERLGDMLSLSPEEILPASDSDHIDFEARVERPLVASIVSLKALLAPGRNVKVTQ